MKKKTIYEYPWKDKRETTIDPQKQRNMRGMCKYPKQQSHPCEFNR